MAFAMSVGISGRSLRWLSIICIAYGLAACRPEAAPVKDAAALAVTTAEAIRSNIPFDLSFTAQTQGSREVEVRARVTGILLKRIYREGAPVAQGDVLFRIDPAPFEARVAQGKATLAVAQAAAMQAQRNRDRVLPLFDKGLASPKERDDAVSALEVAQAQVQAADASLRTSQLELDYTQVRAPISGIASRESRSEGSLVIAGEDSALLTRIVQVEPLYVEFAAPVEEAAMIRNAHQQRPLQLNVLREQGAPHVARLDFIDSALDAKTGTVRMRAVLDNRDHQHWPGQYVRVQLPQLGLSDAIIVPRSAITSNAEGYRVWLIDEQQHAQPRIVQIGRSIGEQVAVTAGLQAGEHYVLDNLFKLQPGMTVKVVPNSMSSASIRSTVDQGGVDQAVGTTSMERG